MSAESTLEAGREAWFDLAADTCRITKAGAGKGPFNETTGQYEPPPRVTVYEGICRLQVKADINSNIVETTAGDRESTYLTATLELPVETPEDALGSVGAIRPDNVCEFLTAQDDPTLVGRQFNMQGIYHKSQAVYRRYRVREVIQ